MPKISMKVAQAVKIPSDTVSVKSVHKGIIATASGSAQAPEAAVIVERSMTLKTSNTSKVTKNAESFNIVHASTKSNKPKFSHTTDVQLRAMVEWLEIPANYKIITGQAATGRSVAHGIGVTKIEGFGRMANVWRAVEPLSHTTIPEQEDHDVDWGDEDDVSLPGNLEVSRAPDADSDDTMRSKIFWEGAGNCPSLIVIGWMMRTSSGLKCDTWSVWRVCGGWRSSRPLWMRLVALDDESVLDELNMLLPRSDDTVYDPDQNPKDEPIPPNEIRYPEQRRGMDNDSPNDKFLNELLHPGQIVSPWTYGHSCTYAPNIQDPSEYRLTESSDQEQAR
ncbi:unnamed protein product [Phytophthora fragariaefolia]|uniref:Unnamed protein product n=1 Tax=Phytophthora fragariaefolia TaxID=1490495 RepID=A0A9W6XV63_9STRA|nr:unnamed protein product [Phytophthora fragariaefolia]